MTSRMTWVLHLIRLGARPERLALKQITCHHVVVPRTFEVLDTLTWGVDFHAYVYDWSDVTKQFSSCTTNQRPLSSHLTISGSYIFWSEYCGKKRCSNITNSVTRSQTKKSRIQSLTKIRTSSQVKNSNSESKSEHAIKLLRKRPGITTGFLFQPNWVFFFFHLLRLRYHN